MATGIRIDRSDIKRVRDLFDGLEASLKDCSPLFTSILRDVLVPSARDTFDAEGPGWRPLSVAYARRKARAIGYTQILVWSGDLRDSVASESGNEFSIREIGPRRMKFGTTRPWSEVHQATRPFLVVLDADYDEILNLSVDFFLSQRDFEQ